MVSSTLCPAVHILGSQNVYSRAESIADHYWPWAVFLPYQPDQTKPKPTNSKNTDRPTVNCIPTGESRCQTQRHHFRIQHRFSRTTRTWLQIASYRNYAIWYYFPFLVVPKRLYKKTCPSVILSLKGPTRSDLCRVYGLVSSLDS